MYVSANLAFTHEAELVTAPIKSCPRYFRSFAFVFDLLCALPYAIFTSNVHPSLPRVPRLLRVIIMRGHLRELSHHFQISKRVKLVAALALLMMVLHFGACMHFSITHLERYGSNATSTWLPSDDLDVQTLPANDTSGSGLMFVTADHVSISAKAVRRVALMQYLRSLYFAATMVTTLGKTIEPRDDRQYLLGVVFMAVGSLIFAVSIDNVQKRFTTSAFEQKEFLATRSRIEQFLRSQNAPVDVYQRVNAFLDFWWSSHCGTIIGEVLSELPDSIKRPVLKSICRPALQTLSLLHGVRPVLKHLEEAFVDNVRFILYGQGEIIYRQGDYASGLFFLLEGEVCIVPADGVPRRVIRGGFFGTASLHLSETSVSYAERMTATSGCILLFMSREHLDVMHQTFPMLSMALKSLEKRLGEPKMAKGSEIVLDDRALSTASPQHSVAPPSRLQVLVSNVLEYIEHLDFDPDVWTTIAWRCVVFGLMSIQCFKVIFDACFGVVATARSDAMTVLIELFFVMDMFFQLHVGYYRYGDKIMDRRLIRRRYLCSFDFAVDVCALAPLFALNWMLPVRLDVLNLNKLVRLLKVPQQFAMIEIQYLNRTLELRLAKLLFYASFLSHTYGCLWACMATLESLESIDSTPGARVWLPPVKLQNASTSLRYLASFYWSLGLMTASYDGELPKTPAQCAFSIIILISGFALLTYVIGNLLDVMELIDADNRDFNAKLNSLRHFLNHFRLPPSIEDKIKTYFFFKRFHTVTQEHVLERCLPPSLLTDIRLVHLQPMIMKVAFLAGMEASVTRMLVSQFVQVLIVKDHSVCRYGEEGNDMYFVFTGVLDILVPTATLRLSAANVDPFKVGGPAPASSASTSKTASMTNNLASTFVRMGSQQAAHLKKVNELTAGSYFGEVALFTTKPRSAQVRSRTSCVLYKLSKSSLEVVFERYPEWKKKVLRIVSIQQEQQRLRNAFMEEQQSATANMNGAKKLSQLDVLDLGHKSNDGSVSTAMGSRRKRSARRMLRRVSSQAPSADAVADMRNRKRRSPLVEALVDGMNVQSGFHLAWLYLMALTTVYMAVLVPYRISLDHLTRLTPVPVLARTLELVCEMLFGLDIWVQSNIRDNSESMELYEQHAHVAYKRDRMLWDVLAAFPVDHFLSDFYASPWLRLNRCFKVLNLQHFFKEIHRSSVAYERHRLQTLWVLYAIIMFWCACAYFSLAKVGGDGSGWDQWAPPAELAIADAEDMPQTRVVALRVLRSCFLAVTMFVKRGKTFMPTHELDLVFGIAAAFVGVVAMAILLGEGAHLFISYIGNEVEFRKSHIAVDTFLERWRVSSSLRARAHAFLASHWSSHRGVNYQSILDETPPAIRTESVLYVAQLPLEAFIKDVFRPITKYGNAMDREIEMLMRTLAQHLKFEGYPRDENVIVEGSISQAMYFVVKGNLLATSAAHAALWSNARLGKGDYFGDKGLLGYSVSAFTVKTQRACDLLSLSSEALLQVILSRPIYQAALSIVVEAYRLVCMRLLTGTSVIEVTDVEWAEMLFHVLSKRKAQWNAHTQAAGPGAAPYQPHEAFKELQRPEHCCEAFYMMLKLIVAQSAVGSNSGRTMSIRSASAAQLDSLPLLNGTSAGLYNSAHNTSSQRSQVRGHGG
ncbi:TPA: hypothetical protein N0F65_004348 [Lagenidium giganteum]|uniref:Cyclic nucleotide-binding domain-containing protein n=1 Tax=Lagenidium giganteum TaxID=4803 RepID=A0AAV2YGE3_9STRA|nr:TPA: hypothetical protein N0F65_004348 [Lagenidium giganteum]